MLRGILEATIKLKIALPGEKTMEEGKSEICKLVVRIYNE